MFGKEGSLMCPPGVLLEKSLQMTNRILSIHKDLECLHLYVNKLFYNFKMLLHVHCTLYSTVSSKFDFFSMSKTIQWDQKWAKACICTQKKKYEKIRIKTVPTIKKQLCWYYQIKNSSVGITKLETALLVLPN